MLAALANPERTVRKMWATREALAGLDIPPVIPITYADVADLGRLVPGDAPHQGLVIEVEPLEDIWLGDLLGIGERGGDRMAAPEARPPDRGLGRSMPAPRHQAVRPAERRRDRADD